jgi:cobalt/nickel transport system permease protein
LPFVLAALPLLVTVAGTPLATVRLGGWAVTFSESGTERFVSTVAKSWISVQAAILLATTTPVQGLLVAMRAVRVPRLLVAVIGLMWRYLFVLADEAGRLLRARAARSGASSQRGARAGGSIAWRARATGGMAGSLFLRSLERADRLYAAMVSRGYDGETRALPAPRVSSGSWWVLGCGLSALTLLVVAGYLFWG